MLSKTNQEEEFHKHRGFTSSSLLQSAAQFLSSSICSTSLDSPTTFPLIMVWVTTFTIFLVLTSGSSVTRQETRVIAAGTASCRCQTKKFTKARMIYKTSKFRLTFGRRRFFFHPAKHCFMSWNQSTEINKLQQMSIDSVYRHISFNPPAALGGFRVWAPIDWTFSFHF